MARYINPYTDFGFKRLFGSEANKFLLIDFLNCLVLPEHRIADLEFRSCEAIPTVSAERRAIFDIRCVSTSGEHFIVEMQKAKVKDFNDRALFYSTFPIKEQADQGGWNFKLKPVYFVAVLDFLYDESLEKAKLLREVQLRDQYGENFSDKLHFRFVQMPAFQKTEAELTTHFDKWCYFLKNLETFDVLPEILREPVFLQSLQTLQEGALTRKELDAYEQSLKYFRDAVVLWNQDMDEARATGLAKGLAKGLAEGLAEGKAAGLVAGLAAGKAEAMLETARKMQAKGLDWSDITEMTGIRREDLG